MYTYEYIYIYTHITIAISHFYGIKGESNASVKIISMLSKRLLLSFLTALL